MSLGGISLVTSHSPPPPGAPGAPGGEHGGNGGGPQAHLGTRNTSGSGAGAEGHGQRAEGGPTIVVPPPPRQRHAANSPAGTPERRSLTRSMSLEQRSSSFRRLRDDSDNESLDEGVMLYATEHSESREHLATITASPTPSPDSEISTPSRLGNSTSYQDLHNAAHSRGSYGNRDLLAQNEHLKQSFGTPTDRKQNIARILPRNPSFHERKSLEAVLHQADYTPTEYTEIEKLHETFGHRFLNALAENGPQLVRSVLHCVRERAKRDDVADAIELHVRILTKRKTRLHIVACSRDSVALFGDLVTTLARADISLREGRAWCSSEKTSLCIMRAEFPQADQLSSMNPSLSSADGMAMHCNEPTLSQSLLGALFGDNTLLALASGPTLRPSDDGTYEDNVDKGTLSDPEQWPRDDSADANYNYTNPHRPQQPQLQTFGGHSLPLPSHAPRSRASPKRKISGNRSSLFPPDSPTGSSQRHADQGGANKSLAETLADALASERKRLPHITSVPMLNPNHLTMDEKLVDGGSGEVWRASLRGVGDVALKVLTRHISDPSEVEAQWMREALALASMPQHPRIVRFYGCTRMLDTGAPALVLELVRGGPAAFSLQHDGEEASAAAAANAAVGSPTNGSQLVGSLKVGSLGSLSGSLTPLTPFTRALAQTVHAVSGGSGTTMRRACSLVAVCRVLLGLASALAHAHEHGVAHRDVKGSNILVPTRSEGCESDGSDMRLCDWGVACAKSVGSLAPQAMEVGPPAGLDDFSKRLSTSPGKEAIPSSSPELHDYTAETGTHRWMAPEVFDGRPYGCSADVYSFGMTMYELLSGQVPHSHLTPLDAARAASAGARPDVAEIAARAPESYIWIMERCWAQDPLRRPAMKDVATLMRDLLSESLSRSAATAFDDAGVRATAAASPIPAHPRVVMNKGLLSKQLGGT
ncbi:hypothetical protein PPROV_000906000 [Pycnococcus provasolii]|uniref:Protein kinase domain-containing protein n=1 Tax=Pycnococcus provasolii TaxID=41880 RepID=A0A830HZS4_9CHLO|nr:hypothetical protein PPROV_000906000 [Pycnococcus provasolii]|mmetsp:Transcript_2499/g.6770  ORF Transcript_2499/g.6770 Transcript_2499/m.6770 type:complete len:932 (-) Transcript_2499:78-2873(-)